MSRRGRGEEGKGREEAKLKKEKGRKIRTREEQRGGEGGHTHPKRAASDRPGTVRVSPAQGHLVGTWTSELLRRGLPGAVSNISSWMLGVTDLTYLRKCVFSPRKICAKRNFASIVRKFTKSLDLLKRTKTKNLMFI